MAVSDRTADGPLVLDLIFVGFGNVARRLVHLLDELAPELLRTHQLATRVVGVATRSRGAVFNRRGLDARALDARFGSPAANPDAPGSPMNFLTLALERSRATARDGKLVVVELTTLDIATGRPAIDHVRVALRSGAHVVTANKGPAAFAYQDLSDEARRADRCFRYESAVLDGIPVFNLVRDTLPAVTVTGFRGVVNSTTNYILTGMERGESFAGALAAMQRAGIAEADPSLDVDGWDAAAKTAALANVLMDGHLTPHAVHRDRLSAASAGRVTAARAAGRRVKLVASAARVGGAVQAQVRLTDLPQTDLLAQLEGQQNALLFQTELLGEFAVVQRSAGLTQTAYGIVSDLTAIARDVRRSTNRTAPTSSRRLPLHAGRRGRSPSRRGRR